MFIFLWLYHGIFLFTPCFFFFAIVGTFEIGLPNVSSRRQILELFLKNQPMTDGARKMIPKLAKDTKGYSGSDLKELW